MTPTHAAVERALRAVPLLPDHEPVTVWDNPRLRDSDYPAMAAAVLALLAPEGPRDDAACSAPTCQLQHGIMCAAHWARALEADLAALRDRERQLVEENARLAKEHTQVHEWNMKLVGQHYDLAERERGLREALEKISAKCSLGPMSFPRKSGTPEQQAKTQLYNLVVVASEMASAALATPPAPPEPRT